MNNDWKAKLVYKDGTEHVCENNGDAYEIHCIDGEGKETVITKKGLGARLVYRDPDAELGLKNVRIVDTGVPITKLDQNDTSWFIKRNRDSEKL